MNSSKSCDILRAILLKSDATPSLISVHWHFRSSRMFLAEEKNRVGPEDQYEEVILTNHIQSLQKEK